VIPIRVSGDRVEVGTDTPLAAGVEQEIAFATGHRVTVVPVATSAVEAYLYNLDLGDLGTAPRSGANASVDLDTALPSPAFESDEDLGVGSVSQQVDRILHEAIDLGASDVHVEPYETDFRVRYRLDGVLHEVGRLNLRQRDAIISRLKILAALDIAEKRRPQDGRIRIDRDDRSVDLRVSTLPTAFGEKVVLRILDRNRVTLDLDALGLHPNDRAVVERAIAQPYGMILVTGPTGSGKTTTLYAALSVLNRADVNVITIEDPVEYTLPGINQTQVKSDIGFTFAQALRAFLRQDPNIVMVGEMRDAETAAIAVRAALTGHLVLSTLHTNDAPSTITRLVDMGVEPYLVAASVRLVIAQRLVRRVCSACAKEMPVEPAIARDLSLDPDVMVKRGTGCPYCNGTGYRGRVALFEVMPIHESLIDGISRGIPTSELRHLALDGGMRTLRAHGLRLLKDGVTTSDEVLRETTL